MYYEHLGELGSIDLKQSLIEAYNKTTLVGRPACYIWSYSGIWFGCGYIYSNKRHGELFAIKYVKDYNYIIQCLEGELYIRNFNTTTV